MDDIFFMDAAYRQALKAKSKNEVPIGAVLVNNSGKIITRAYNQVEKKGTVLAHAELLTLAKAVKKMKNWRLSGTTLYVTLQPCMMCLGALYLSRIDRVVYGVESLKFGASLNLLEPNLKIYKNLGMKVECLNYVKAKDLLQLFFQKKRSLVHDQ